MTVRASRYDARKANCRQIAHGKFVREIVGAIVDTRKDSVSREARALADRIGLPKSA